MRHVVFGLILPLFLAALLYYFLIKPNAFNFPPYLIHESYFSDSINETTFIEIFDAAVALIVGVLLRIFFYDTFSQIVYSYPNNHVKI